MKRSIIYFSVLLLFIVSCEETLDFEVKDRLTLENYFLSADDALASVNGIYDVLGQVHMYNSSMWLIQDISSDDCDASPTWNDPNAQQFDRYTLQANNNYTTNMWKASYDMISKANLSIDSIPVIDMDETLQNRFLGEAKFLRALSYFNLVRLFGGVPLVLHPETDIDAYLVPRAEANLVYDQIIQDLEDAAATLPSSYGSTDKGRATRGSALGILSKVYLTLQEWGLAAEMAGKVMEIPVYGLWDDFTDNFKEVNKNGKESIFDVQFYSEVQSENSRIVISGLPGIYAFPAGVGMMRPTEDLLNSFEQGDYRYEATFFEEYDYFGHNTFDPHIWKHWDQDTYPPAETGSSGANFPVMRYAEILLIYAEALNEANQGPTQEAYEAVNRVRQRARNGDDSVLPDLSGLSYQEFQDAVLKEKRNETVNEGHRWFDLVRTGNLEEYVKRAKGDKANPQEFNYVFPIPQREIDLNDKLEQNDNY